MSRTHVLFFVTIVKMNRNKQTGVIKILQVYKCRHVKINVMKRVQFGIFRINNSQMGILAQFSLVLYEKLGKGQFLATNLNQSLG